MAAKNCNGSASHSFARTPGEGRDCCGRQAQKTHAGQSDDGQSSLALPTIGVGRGAEQSG